jgi:hypothetical protein
MTFVMKEDVALDPVDVQFLGPNGVMLHAKDLADLVEKFGLWVGDDLRRIFEVIISPRSTGRT